MVGGGINHTRRTAIKSLGGLSLAMFAAVGGASADQTELSKCSSHFNEVLDKHGPIVDENIDGLKTPSGQPSPDFRVKYTFEDGKKAVAMYRIKNDIIQIKFRNDTYNLDKHSYVAKLERMQEKMSDEIQKQMDEDLKMHSDRNNGGQ